MIGYKYTNQFNSIALNEIVHRGNELLCCVKSFTTDHQDESTISVLSSGLCIDCRGPAVYRAKSMIVSYTLISIESSSKDVFRTCIPLRTVMCIFSITTSRCIIV